MVATAVSGDDSTSAALGAEAGSDLEHPGANLPAEDLLPTRYAFPLPAEYLF